MFIQITDSEYKKLIAQEEQIRIIKWIVMDEDAKHSRTHSVLDACVETSMLRNILGLEKVVCDGNSN